MENIKLKEKIGYGLGDAASSMFWKLFGVYLLFYYTDVVGLPAAAIGTMFLITRIWDTFLDPIVGLMADRTDTRWGKFRPYILWMAVPFGLCGILTFSVPELNQTQGLIYAYVTYTLMMMVYSFINVPYASLLGVISADPKVRTELSSYRMVFAFAGSILVLFLIEPLVAFFGKIKGDGILVDQALGWQMALVFFAAIATFFFLCTFAWTKERIRPMKEESNRFKDDLMDLVCNKPWWILLGAGVAALVFNSMRDGSTIFYFKYYVKDVEAFKFGFIDASVSLTSIYLVLGQAANIIGILFVTPVANKIGRKKTYFVAMVLASIFSVVFYFIDANNILLVMALQVLISICAGSIFPLLWAMYADIADFSEWKTGRRATGLIFSSSSMSQKLGWTIGGALTGWLLAYFGFKSNVQQTEMAQNGIRMMMSFFPAIGALLSAVFISLYSLSEVKLEGITRELNEKRNQIIKDAQ
ncbi:transporter [Bacteroidales bacterium]|nr:transporter [Bacteroidales bacterium]